MPASSLHQLCFVRGVVQQQSSQVALLPVPLLAADGLATHTILWCELSGSELPGGMMYACDVCMYKDECVRRLGSEGQR